MLTKLLVLRNVWPKTRWARRVREFPSHSSLIYFAIFAVSDRLPMRFSPVPTIYDSRPFVTHDGDSFVCLGVKSNVQQLLQFINYTCTTHSVLVVPRSGHINLNRPILVFTLTTCLSGRMIFNLWVIHVFHPSFRYFRFVCDDRGMINSRMAINTVLPYYY